MIAIILAAGIGSRLMPLTKNIPKSLVKIYDDKTILDLEIDYILYQGIRKFIITVGYRAKKIRKHIKKKYPELNVVFIENAKYDSTNCIYSLWLTKNVIDDDVLLLHGDLVLDRNLFQLLLKSKPRNSVLINEQIVPPKKDFKALIKNGVVKKIDINLKGNNVYYCAPIYELKYQSFMRWLKEIELFIKNGNTNSYAEDAFNTISEEIKLVPVFYSKGFCMEIDLIHDLEKARKYFSLENFKTKRDI